jgi:hypothetical protein
MARARSKCVAGPSPFRPPSPPIAESLSVKIGKTFGSFSSMLDGALINKIEAGNPAVQGRA